MVVHMDWYLIMMVPKCLLLDISTIMFTNIYCLHLMMFLQLLMPEMERLSIGAQETYPVGLEFNNDGTKMYVIGDSGNDINEYNLLTAFDVSSATYAGNSEEVSYSKLMTPNLNLLPVMTEVSCLLLVGQTMF